MKQRQHRKIIFLPVPIHKSGGMETRILATKRICEELEIKPVFFKINKSENETQREISRLLSLENEEIISFDPGDFREFARIINQRQPIAVLAFNSRLAQSAYSYIHPPVLRVSVSNAVHYSGFYKTFFMLSSADILLYETDLQRRQWSKICNLFGVKLVSDAYYFERPTKHKQVSSKRMKPISILYLGRIEEKTKQISFIPKLYKALKDSNIEFVLTIAGDGPDTKLLTTISDCPEVRMHNYIFGFEKNKILYESDILILPSYSEGFGMVILEAALTNTLTISNVMPHLKASFGNAVIQIETNDIDRWVQEIRTFSEDREKLENWKISASQLISDKYTNIENVKRSYITLFQSNRVKPIGRQNFIRKIFQILDKFPKLITWRVYKAIFKSVSQKEIQ